MSPGWSPTSGCCAKLCDAESIRPAVAIVVQIRCRNLIIRNSPRWRCDRCLSSFSGFAKSLKALKRQTTRRGASRPGRLGWLGGVWSENLEQPGGWKPGKLISGLAADRDNEKADGLPHHCLHSRSALVIVVVTGVFFRVMSSIVSLVSWARACWGAENSPFRLPNTQHIEFVVFFYAAKLSTPAPLSRSASCLRA